MDLAQHIAVGIKDAHDAVLAGGHARREIALVLDIKVDQDPLARIENDAGDIEDVDALTSVENVSVNDVGDCKCVVSDSAIGHGHGSSPIMHRCIGPPNMVGGGRGSGRHDHVFRDARSWRRWKTTRCGIYSVRRATSRERDRRGSNRRAGM